MELSNSQIVDEELSPVETPSLKVVAEEKDGGNGLAKARGTLVKSGGPSPRRPSTPSTWKRSLLGSKLHLESGV